MNYEKVSVNIDDKKLSQIDLLVENGFYSNRSDFINEAVQRQLDKDNLNIVKILHQNSIDSNIINDNIWFIGVQNFSKEYLTRVKQLEKKINVKGFGILAFSSDCDDDLIKETIQSVSKKITIHASEEIKKYYRK